MPRLSSCRALACAGAIVLLGPGCVRRIPETGDWEADAKANAAGPLRCEGKELNVQTIDRTFFEREGRFGARRMIVAVTGCDQEVVLVWTPEAGWLHHPPQAFKPKVKSKTGPVLDGKVINP